jgi:hypothetical protein
MVLIFGRPKPKYNFYKRFTLFFTAGIRAGKTFNRSAKLAILHL